jgi:hypothetical protein
MTATASHTGLPSAIGRYVNHDRVAVRFVSLWLVVAVVFSVAWVASYHLLPQGLLRGANTAPATYAGSVPAEFVRLFGWNVAVSLVTVGANTFRSDETPLGYVLQVVQAPRYAAVWGTGSLAVGAVPGSNPRSPCFSPGAGRSN